MLHHADHLENLQKVVGALGLIDYLDSYVPLDGPGAAKWKRYARHEADARKQDPKIEPKLTVRDILRKGKLAPLTKDMVMAVSISSIKETSFAFFKWLTMS